MAELFRAAPGVDDVGAEDDFYALAATRLGRVCCSTSSKRTPGYGSPLMRSPDRSLFVASSNGPGDLGRPAGPASWASGWDSPGPPLFCMMAAFQARTLALYFNVSAGRPFYAVQQAGLEGRSPVDRSIRRRARRAVEDIRSVQPTGPYLLAGYSSDADIACEVARRLREMGEEVDLVVAIDVWAPYRPPLKGSVIRVKARWKDVCERHPQDGLPYDVLRLTLFARANAARPSAGSGGGRSGGPPACSRGARPCRPSCSTS